MKFRHNLIYTALFTSASMSVMAEEIATLDEVNVVAELEKFKANENLKADVNLSLLGRQLAFNSPITVVNYDEKAFADKEPRNVVDAIAKTDASVMNFGGETNTLQGVYIRGLQLDARQFSVNGLAGLYSTYNSPTAAVSSAQLIKGASTATTGMDPEGSSGASLNVETKRATDEDINKVGLAWFSNNRLQESFDFGRRFGANKEWGIRINGKYRDGDTARNNYDERAKELAIGADYRGDKLRVGVDYMHNKRKTDGGRARIQDMQNFGFAMPAAPNGKTNLNPEWVGQTTRDETLMGTFEYDLPYNMMISGGAGYMQSRYYGSFGQITTTRDPITGALRNYPFTEEGDFYLTGLRGMDTKTRTFSSNLKLTGEADTGSIHHSWNLAVDNVERKRIFDRSASAARVYGGSIYNPVFTLQTPNVNIHDISDNNRNEKLTARSVALSDTLGFFDNSLRLTLGGRFQWIKQEDRRDGGSTLKADRFSPMVAVAYSYTPNIVFYGNYLEDLEPGNADPDTNEMNSPRVTKQVEIGVRQNWTDNITTTLSAYQIKRPGIIYGGGNNAPADKKALHGKEHGEERNRGIEFNIYANLLDKTLRPSFGISYNQGKVFDFPTYSYDIVNGVQVTSPRIIMKANIEWDTIFNRNLTLNAGLQHYGKSYQDTAARYKLPSYTTVDVGAKYNFKFAGNQELVVRAGVENLFNKHYWQVQRGQYDRSFAVLGMPRTYWVKTEYSF